jgi:hypothetical protein
VIARPFLTLAVASLALFATVGPVFAEIAPTGKHFGCHASAHARAGDLGPGMNFGQHHRGFSGWDGKMPC